MCTTNDSQPIACGIESRCTARFAEALVQSIVEVMEQCAGQGI
jgi:hypothetical protein